MSKAMLTVCLMILLVVVTACSPPVVHERALAAAVQATLTALAPTRASVPSGEGIARPTGASPSAAVAPPTRQLATPGPTPTATVNIREMMARFDSICGRRNTSVLTRLGQWTGWVEEVRIGTDGGWLISVRLDNPRTRGVTLQGGNVDVVAPQLRVGQRIEFTGRFHFTAYLQGDCFITLDGARISGEGIDLMATPLPTPIPTATRVPPTRTPPMEGRAGVVGGEVVITNDNGFDWTDVEIIINPSGFLSTGGYTYRMARIRAGQTVSIPASDFTQRDGTRFNIRRTAVMRIMVSTKQGTRSVNF